MHLLAPIALLAVLVGIACALWMVRRETQGARAAAFMLLAQALWVACWIGETASSGLATKLRWDGVAWPTMVLAMATSLWVAQTQSPRRTSERLGMLALLLITLPISLWSTIVSWRDGRAGAQMLDREPFDALIYDFTWFETGLSLFLLLVVVWSALAVLVGAVRGPRGHRAHGALLAIGLLGPYVMEELAFLFDATWYGQRDVAPLAFALFAPFVALPLLRARASSLVLVAREQVLEELADAIVVVDARGRLLDVNEVARALLGGGATVGRALREVPGAEALIAALQSEPEAQRGVALAGRRFDVRVAPVRAGAGPDARVVVLHDVTALHDANAALRTARDELETRVRERTAELLERERTLAAIFDHGVQYMGLLDTEGRVLACNRASLALIEMEADAVLGRLVWETPWWDHDAEQAQRVCEGVRVAAAGTPFNILTTHRDANGNVREVDFILTPVRDEQDVVRRLVAEGRDLSELRRYEREGEALRRQLHHLQRLDSIGRLAGGVAHDFNNYLTAIIGNGELARRAVPPGSTAMTSIDELLHAARSAADVTRQLLAIGRRQPAGKGPVDVSVALERMRSFLARILGEEIALDLHAADAGHAAIDPGPLEQVLVNLAINARDAMPDGGMLAVAAQTVMLDAAAARRHALVPGPYVRIGVADTGHGMSEEVRAQVFEPFFTTKPEGAGTGLGLAIVYSIVRGAGGHVEVTSAPGAGARFLIHLPRAVVAERARPVVAPMDEHAGRGHVLVVDDRDEVRYFVARALTERGFAVRVAADGRAALDAVARERPDLVLCDVRMPGMSGPAVMRELRERGDVVPVLYMSGQHDPSAGLGPSDRLLPKPFTLDALVTAVREALLEAQPAN